MTVNRKERSGQALDPQIRVLVTVLGAAAFIAVLDGTAVTASLDTLAASFGTDLSLILWVTTAYLLAAGAVLPLVGWAIGRFGGREVFLAGLALFVAGSVLTGLAASPAALIGFRVLQGLGGGLVEPAAIAVAAAAAPRDQVGRVTGRFSLVVNIAPVVGPLVGTLLADHGLWRWIFLLNLPLGLLIVAAALRFVPGGGAGRVGSRAPEAPPDSPDARESPVSPDAPGASDAPDLIGMALLAPGFVAALFAVNRAGDGADPGVTVAAGAVAVLLLVGYVGHALRTERAPVLDLRLLATPAYAAALLVMCAVGFVMFSQLSVLPRLAAEGFGQEGLARGVIVSALGVGLLVSMAGAARISDRTGPRVLVVTGSLVAAAGLLVMALVHESWPLAAVLALYVVIGLGFGSVASPSFASVYRALPPAQAAQGTTALFVAVQLFASTGVTVMGVLLERVTGDVFGAVFGVLAVVLLVAAAVGSRLPGRA